MLRQRKSRLLLALGILLAAGFLATSLAGYYSAKSSLREQITRSELPLTGDNIYSEIQRDLLRPIFISSLMSNDTFLRDWILAGEKDVGQITRYLDEIQFKYDTFTSFFVSEKSRIYYHSKGILKRVKEEEPRDRWYFRVREMKEDYEINIDPDMANDDTVTVFINYKVYDYDGNYIGATGVGLTVYAVKALLKRYQEEYGRNIFFTDRKGNVTLYAPDRPPAGNSLAEMEGLSSLAETILAAPAGTYRYQRDGKTVHLNTRYIREFGWHLLVEQSEEKAIRGIKKTLALNLALSLAATVLVLFFFHLALSAYRKEDT